MTTAEQGAVWRVEQLIVRWLGPETRVLAREAPIAAAFFVAVATVPLRDDRLTHPSLVIASVAVMGGLLLAAWRVPGSLLPPRATVGVVVAIVNFLIVALLRAGTGDALSPYASLVYLVVVTVAAQPWRGSIMLATAGAAFCALDVLSPNAGAWRNGQTMLRALTVAAVSFLIALFVHTALGNLRARNAALVTLEGNQRSLLGQTRRDAAELRSVIDSVTEQAIIATDAHGVIEVFNTGAWQILGWSPSQAVGRMSVVEFHDRSELRARHEQIFGLQEDEPTDADLFRALVEPPDVADDSPVQDWMLVRRDGERLRVQLLVTPHVGPGGPDGYVFVARDVTAERETERLRDEFISLVSHELRTPLTAMLGYLELVLEPVQPAPDEELGTEHREYLEIVERNARRQLRLVTDLLTASQLDAGKFAVLPVPIDVRGVAHASVVSARPAANAARVRLEFQGVAVVVPADETRVGQVVDNLVGNAIKFTPAGGTVAVHTGPDPGAPGGAVISVRDTGEGIAPEELEHLTKRFFRTTSAVHRAVPGVGLGLAIADAVARAHGGRLEIASVVGEGTTMTLRLPPAHPH